MQPQQPTSKPQDKKLLDQVRDHLRLKHYAYRTEETYVSWIKRFILFHGKRHPRDMGSTEIEAFVTHLAVERNIAVTTQNQALSAILFFPAHLSPFLRHAPLTKWLRYSHRTGAAWA